MKISKELIKSLDPCKDGLKWYLVNGTDDLLQTLLSVNVTNPLWAIWLYTKLMNLKQLRMIAVFAAEQVLPIFEKQYPNDLRPRKAIEAAKVVIENDSKENRIAARAAATKAEELQERIIHEAVRILEFEDKPSE